MAFKNLTPNTFIFFLLLFSTLLSLLPKQGVCTQNTLIRPHLDSNLIPKDLKEVGFWRWREKNARRLMIGSIAPTCTYNECRGCRYRCRAEQVPVDANDPVNSAYRYRCVCHR
ncbi:EPIDERMAL PATTERNING FACTOR-like protein 9 [Asparagus officinalis]|uniref:EPIDERMAL PATTERNING FACTOR-like protein 9 n=1 Tax=Asparagus officinalis TaxID=4686 RepID=UPI00098E772E|nr:EPIDERMAL PATTERNING FACTOR-like protein 9 [Asparagus officinalis]